MTDRRAFLARSGALALAAFLPARERVERALAELGEAGAGPAADEYLLGPDVVYLNHGSIGTVPRVVHEAHVSYLRTCETNPHLHLWGGAWDAAVESTRARVARLLGCGPGDVALTHNTTEGFNVLAQGLPLGPGDEVVFTGLNHASASWPWHYYGERRGYRVREVPFPLEDVPGLSVADVVALHMGAVGPATRVLVFPHVDNIVGLRHPIRELVAAARARGVEWVAVDVAQSQGMLPIDAAEEGADFYAGSPHKWLQAPKGTGLLVARGEAAKRLEPLWVKHPRAALPADARVFEDYSTRNLPAVLALGDAIAFNGRIPPAERERRHLAAARRWRERVEATRGLRWRSPRDPRLASSLFAVEVTGAAAAEVAGRLWDGHRIVVRGFPPPIDTLRISPNLQTTEAEMDAFFAAVT